MRGYVCTAVCEHSVLCVLDIYALENVVFTLQSMGRTNPYTRHGMFKWS